METTEDIESELVLMLDMAQASVTLVDMLDMVAPIATTVVMEVMERALAPTILMHHLPVTTLRMEKAQSKATRNSVAMEAATVAVMVQSLADLATERVVISDFTIEGLTIELDHLLSRSTCSQIPKNDRVKTLQVVFIDANLKSLSQ